MSKLFIMLYYGVGAYFILYKDYSVSTHGCASHVSQIPVASLVHFLFNYMILYCFLDAHLVYLSFHYCNHCKYRSYGSVSCYRIKCLLVNYAFFWGESKYYKYCLSFFNVVVCSMLDLLVPLGRHYILPFWSQYHIPDIILHD